MVQFLPTKQPLGWPVVNFLYQPTLENTLEELLDRYPHVRCAAAASSSTSPRTPTVSPSCTPPPPAPRTARAPASSTRRRRRPSARGTSSVPTAAAAWSGPARERDDRQELPGALARRRPGRQGRASTLRAPAVLRLHLRPGPPDGQLPQPGGDTGSSSRSPTRTTRITSSPRRRCAGFCPGTSTPTTWWCSQAGLHLQRARRRPAGETGGCAVPETRRT